MFWMLRMMPRGLWKGMVEVPRRCVDAHVPKGLLMSKPNLGCMGGRCPLFSRYAW